MSAIRQPGRINKNTRLIDIGMWGVAGVGAVYLIQGDKKCLIDGGTRTEASRLVKTLRKLDSFPPDIIIATHAHDDHVQGIPILRKEAAREGKTIEVLASQKAIPLLEGQSYNEVFDAGPYEAIRDVTPLEEDDTVDLGGITLRIYEVPGHSKEHIAILDERNRNIFVGDAIGDKVTDHMFLPPFFPPSWDPDAFLSSMKKLKKVDYESLCLAHFGYVYEDEAKSILDEAVLTWKAWWQLFAENADRLYDVDYLLEVVLREIALDVPDFRILSLSTKFRFGMTTIWSKLVRKRPRPIGESLLREVLEGLAMGYKTYENQ
jgi:glyoxylase-like metal-dependent hydrolase (beta-lactamase superfamily II)